MAKLQGAIEDDYEIRLIIWEAHDVPLTGGSQNIQVKVIYDPTGWSGEGMEKATDIHYGSKNGKGEFNWRFKFDLSTSCKFPRLKF